MKILKDNYVYVQLKKTYFYDFVLEKERLIIEVNGDYWHANPNIYKPDDIIHYPNNNLVKAKEIWENDKNKKELAIDSNYRIIYIWESEMININDENVFLNLLNEKIK